jgi:hypothetical protein
MSVSVSTTTLYSISHGDQHSAVPAELVKLVGGKPFLKLKATHYKLVRLIVGGQVGNIAKNSSLAANTGLRKLIELRNVASGFAKTGSPPPNKLIAEGDCAERPTKKQRWHWESGSHQQPGEHLDDPVVVSFQVAGYDGLVTAIKAYHAKEELVVAMDDAVLDIVFSLIIGSGVDLEPKKRVEK